MVKHPKRPRDPNQLGKMIVDLSRGTYPTETVDMRRIRALQAMAEIDQQARDFEMRRLSSEEQG